MSSTRVEGGGMSLTRVEGQPLIDASAQVEVQIRSEAMEYVAEQGTASHTDYFKDQFAFLEPTPETPYRSLGSSAFDPF